MNIKILQRHIQTLKKTSISFQNLFLLISHKHEQEIWLTSLLFWCVITGLVKHTSLSYPSHFICETQQNQRLVFVQMNTISRFQKNSTVSTSFPLCKPSQWRYDKSVAKRCLWNKDIYRHYKIQLSRNAHTILDRPQMRICELAKEGTQRIQIISFFNGNYYFISYWC